jgi:hypothetical protein
MLALSTARLLATVPASALVAGVVAVPCRCGHDATVHEHWRAGSDCATCDCTRYRSTQRRLRRGR